jgi:HEAT repeat protein
MNPMKTLTALLTALLLLASPAARADALDDVLARMPAKNVPDEAAIVSKLMSGGAPAVRDLSARLVSLGTEGKDDTAVRFAVTALVRYAGRPGGEADRAAFALGLCESLDKASDPEVKTFLINRLQETGRDDAVPTLARCLGDEHLAPHAAAALERIATPAATDALNKALPAATGGTRVSLIKSLGMLRSAASVEEIAKSLNTDDAVLKATAAWALANLGSDRAADVLAAYVKQGSLFQRGQAFSWMLLAAQRQAESGRLDDCVRTCRTVMGFANDGTAGPNVAGAVLHVLARAQGEGALNDLLEAAASEHPQYRNAALDAALSIPGPATTTRFVERLNRGASPAVKVDLLNFLARRNDPAAHPAVLRAVKDEDAAVRAAALSALVAMGREQAIPALVDRITADTPEVAKPAAEMLARIPGDKPLAAAAEALPAAPPKARVALIELLAARGARAQKDAVLRQTADADASVRTAALRAMEKLAAEADAPRLVELTVAARDATEESAALRAAVAAASQAADADHRADALLSALAKATGPKRATLERGLARVGGRRALDAVLADTKSTDPAVREGAIRALADWQDPAAVAPLLDIARTQTDADLQVTALRGAIQVIKSAKLSDTDKAAAYAKAMSATQRPEERKMILGALGNEKGQPFFDLAATALDQPDLHAEAALATIKTALPPARNQPGVRGPKVAETLKRAIPLCPDPNLKDDATRYLKTLERNAAK